MSASHPLAVSAGLNILRQGGTAADASVGAAAVLGVVLPEACGLGGDSLMLVRESNGAETAFNGTGAAPAALELPVPRYGAASATVPGCVDGWFRMHERFGMLEMDEVLAEAISLARDGFPVSPQLALAFESAESWLGDRASGWPLRGSLPGQIVRQPALATTLETIGRDGRDAFYSGELAEKLVDDFQSLGGRLSEQDLRDQQTVMAEPLTSTYGRFKVTVQPPVSQGVLALAALRQLESQEDTDDPGERALRGARAFASVFNHKHLLSDRRSAAALVESSDSEPGSGTDLGGPRGGTHTAAVTVADRDGCVVSQLVSIFEPFGSRALVGSGGYLLNNRLSDTADDPASPNAPGGGRRPVHTLSPTVTTDGERVIALATPGADGQVQIIAQVIQALADDGQTIPEALEQPRWRVADGKVSIEAGAPTAIADRLRDHGIVTVQQAFGAPHFGAMVAAGVDLRSGSVFAASDGRRESWAGVC